MKIWLDDIRPAPAGWVWAKTFDKCVFLLSNNKVEEISLDHDLGTKESGYDILCLMETWVINRNYNPPKINIHSANPVGRARMELAIQSIVFQSLNL